MTANDILTRLTTGGPATGDQPGSQPGDQPGGQIAGSQQAGTGCPAWSCPAWISEAAAAIDPPKFGGVYETTAVNFFPEVTVRVPLAGQTRRGKPRFQRRRLDLVALVQSHYKKFEPVAIGVEIKVARADLLGDEKMTAYLPYVHRFYLAVPPDLEDEALAKAAHLPGGPVGLLVVHEREAVRCYHAPLGAWT